MRFEEHLTVDQAVHFSMQICEGMKHAHNKNLGQGRTGLLHRDLKPENILIRSYDQCVKITDLGLARTIQDAPSTAIAGTISYMAPEQLTRPELVDKRTDVYSFGVVLYEMLTRRIPYDRPNVFGDLTAPSITHYNPLVPRELEKLAFKCLEYDMNERPSGFEQVQATLCNHRNPGRVFSSAERAGEASYGDRPPEVDSTSSTTTP